MRTGPGRGLLSRMARRARRRHARGHVSILFAVALLFICALVFFVIGAGQRYLQKETVQGAADAAAFSAAVAEAKVFNTVAFINLDDAGNGRIGL